MKKAYLSPINHQTHINTIPTQLRTPKKSNKILLTPIHQPKSPIKKNDAPMKNSMFQINEKRLVFSNLSPVKERPVTHHVRSKFQYETLPRRPLTCGNIRLPPIDHLKLLQKEKRIRRKLFQ